MGAIQTTRGEAPSRGRDARADYRRAIETADPANRTGDMARRRLDGLPPAPGRPDAPDPVAPEAEVLLEAGTSALRRQDFDSAIRLMDRALEIEPRFVEALYTRGLARSEKAELELALDDLQRALDLDPGFAAAYYQRGNIFRFQGDLRGAITEFSNAVGADPDLQGAWYARADARVLLRDLEGAISDLRRAVEAGPSTPLAAKCRERIAELERR